MLAGVALWHIGLKYYYVLKKVRFRLAGIMPTGWADATVGVSVYIDVDNPTNVDVAMKEFTGSILLNDRTAIKDIRLVPALIKNHAISTLQINGIIDLKEIGEELMNQLKGVSALSIAIRVMGNLKVAQFSIPIDEYLFEK